MALFNKDLQKLQALMMIQMKVGQGMSNREVAKSMNLHVETVERRLLFAEKAGLFIQLEQQIMNDLVPAGMKALKTAMEDGDAETALELFKCIGILKDPRAQKTQTQVHEEDELAKAIGEAREMKQLEAQIVDGSVVGRSGLAGLLEASESGPDQPAVVEFVASVEEAVDAGPHEV